MIPALTPVVDTRRRCLLRGRELSLWDRGLDSQSAVPHTHSQGGILNDVARGIER
jgi:hypothetical protein